MDSMFFEKEITTLKNLLGEDFNQKILKALKKYDYPYPSFHLAQRGRAQGETAYVFVENGTLVRAEYWNDDGCAHTIDLVEDQDMKEILIKHIKVSKNALKKTFLASVDQSERTVEEFFHNENDTNF